VGIVMVGVALVAGLWVAFSGLFGGRAERSWEERFQLAEEAAKALDTTERLGDSLLVKMKEFTQKHQGTAAAAVTLLELADAENRRAEGLRDEKPKDARGAFEKAASAAGQFIADFPAHPDVALAEYAAGRARLGLQEWERAAEHFEKASRSQVAALAALARLQAGYCYEQLGRLAQARLKYEELRSEPLELAGWCAEQAKFALAQLGRRPSKPPQEPGPAVKPPAKPAPSK